MRINYKNINPELIEREIIELCLNLDSNFAYYNEENLKKYVLEAEPIIENYDDPRADVADYIESLESKSNNKLLIR